MNEAAKRDERWQWIDPHPNGYDVESGETTLTFPEFVAWRMSEIEAWINRPAVRLARRIRRALRVTR